MRMKFIIPVITDEMRIELERLGYRVVDSKMIDMTDKEVLNLATSLFCLINSDGDSE